MMSSNARCRWQVEVMPGVQAASPFQQQRSPSESGAPVAKGVSLDGARPEHRSEPHTQ